MGPRARPASSRGDLSCVAFELSTTAFQAYACTLGLTLQQAFTGLTHSLAISLAASDELTSPPLTLLARGGDRPVFAWIGVLDAPLRSSLETQVPALETRCAHLRYLHYPDIHDACRRLAAALVSRFGHEELSRADFAAIPNGGFVVLGLLASILGLPRRQTAASEGSGSLLIVVDDCAISGLRFREYLDSCRSGRIVFAPLVSPPALRAAIEAAEERVIGCLSGEDLREIPGSPSPEHQERRRQRLARGDGYWIGSTEPLCFPWNEPDRSLWNSVSERHERAWRIVPPELCLKNQVAPGARSLSVQIQPEARGPLRPSGEVLFAELDQEIVVCDLRDGRVFRLGSTGSSLWRGIVAGGDLESAIRTAAEEFETTEEVLRADAQRFVEDLLGRGLLAG